MLNLNQIKTFVTVIEEGSLSAAADKLKLTQPAVSLHIQNVEDYFGVTLLNRRGREIELTPVGESLFREGKKLIASYQKIEDAIFTEIFRSKNRIAIGAGPIMIDYFIPHMMGFFKKNHPGIDLVAEPMETDNIVRGVLDHSLDVGFIGYNVKNSKLAVEEWVRDELLLIVPPEHPFARKEYIYLDDLKGQEFVWHKEVTGIRMFFEDKIKKAGKDVDISPAIIVSSTMSVLTSVQAGLGISLISRWVAEKPIQAGMIASVPIKDVSLTRNLYVITHRLKKKPPVVLKFLEAAKEFKSQARL
ncbi:MAG: LysR substrate-binding domain-containing protein [Bacillota bacterium]